MTPPSRSGGIAVTTMATTTMIGPATTMVAISFDSTSDHRGTGFVVSSESVLSSTSLPNAPVASTIVTSGSTSETTSPSNTPSTRSPWSASPRRTNEVRQSHRRQGDCAQHQKPFRRRGLSQGQQEERCRSTLHHVGEDALQRVVQRLDAV